MLKLLLSNDRHALRREYIARVFNVYLIILIILCAVMMVLLFIPHLFVRVQDAAVTNELDNAKIIDGSKQRADFEKLSRHVQFEYDLFTAPIIKPFDVLSRLTAVPSEGIELTSINVLKNVVNDKKGEVSLNITLSGNAKDRGALVAYSKNLEADEFFEKVLVPPTNFTKDSDITFTITLMTTLLPKNI